MKRIQNYNIGLFLIAFLLVSCDSEDNGNGPENDAENRVREVAVETVTIQPGNFEDYIRLSGVVEALEDAVISAEISGRVMEIAERGQSFERGEVVARLDDRLFRAGYDAAKTSFELADDTFNRMQALYADSIISTQDYNSARAQRDQARAQLEQAEKQLEDSRITAPFNGRVEERMVRSGELINPGMPVVRLVNTDRVRITAGVPERFSRDIREGSPVRLAIRTNGKFEREAEVTFAGNVIDSETRTYTVEIEIRNPEGLIKPEMVVDIHVRRRTLEDAIVIPRTAIVRDEEGSNVFIARERNGRKVADLVSVETGMASGPVIEITDGLSAGDEVVVRGMSNLSLGDRLNIRNNRDSGDHAEEIQLRNGQSVSY